MGVVVLCNCSKKHHGYKHDVAHLGLISPTFSWLRIHNQQNENMRLGSWRGFVSPTLKMSASQTSIPRTVIISSLQHQWKDCTSMVWLIWTILQIVFLRMKQIIWRKAGQLKCKPPIQPTEPSLQSVPHKLHWFTKLVQRERERSSYICNEMSQQEWVTIIRVA